ncbi:MAG: hypothetical protein FWB79_04460 [Treponema sp.]|nr:hypothetical protein [Treponema sp.]
MKKMVAVSVILAFVAGGAFAISLSGEIIGGIRVLQGTTSDADDEIRSTGSMGRLRLEATGAMPDGTFGGWLRLEGHLINQGRADWDPFYIQGHGWWQPHRMFWLAIGNNGDGFFERSGLAAWDFYRVAGNVGIVDPGNAWAGGYGPDWLVFYNAFYGGFEDWGGMITIRPIPELSLNFGIPFISMNTDPIDFIIQSAHAQVVFHQGWGNIAVTYVGGGDPGGDNHGSVFAYLNLRAIDSLILDFGVGLNLEGADPEIGIGLAAQYTISSEFGLRARTLFHLNMADYSNNGFLFDLLPFFSLTPNVTIFCGLGIALDLPDEGDAVIDWHVNPYVEIGAEWGPRFFAGFRLWSVGGAADGHLNWAIPVGIRVGL